MPRSSSFLRFPVSLAGVLLTAALAGCGSPGPDASDVLGALADGDDARAWSLSGSVVAADSVDVDGWIARARVGLRTERTVAGLEAADRAIALDPQHAEAWLLKAYLEQKRFRNVAAVAAADSARRLAPDDPRCVRATGELRLGGGMVGTADYDGAEAAFRAALELDREDPRATFGLARTRVLAGRREEARPLVERAMGLRPAWPGPWYDRGVIRMRDRDLEGAAADFGEAVRRDPFDASAWFNRARVLPRLDRSGEAEAARREAERARSRTGPLQSLGVSWHSSAAAGNGLQLARALREAGRIAEALRLSRTLATDHEGVPPAHLEHAEAALADDRPEEALMAAERALERAPRNPRGWRARLRAAQELGDDPRAHAAADASWSGSPEAELEWERAVLLLRLGRAAEAEAPLRRAAEAWPQDVAVVAALGRLAAAMGRPSEAEARLSAAVQVDPRPEWLLERAKVLRAMDRLSAAKDDLHWAVEREPLNAEAWAMLAEVQRALGSEEEAARCEEQRDEALRRRQAVREARARADASPLDVAAAERLAEALLAADRPHAAAQVWEAVDTFGREP